MSEMNSFEDAFYIIAKELGFYYAQPLSPREVFEQKMLPRIRELIATHPTAGEPVATVLSSRKGNDTSVIDKALPDGTKLYLSPPYVADVAETVNKDNWLPIEKAPLDGTEILLCRGSRVSSGAWVVWSSSDSVHGSNGAYLGEVEYESGADWASWDGGFTEEEPPTHWMPLPTGV